MSLPQQQNKLFFLPNIGDFIFLLVLYISIIVKPEMILSDGSTGWHLISGNYILQNHCLPKFDLISYTFADKTWVAYEWLCDLIMALVVKAGGLNLLHVVSDIVIALLFLLLYNSCRKAGCNFLLSTVMIIMAVLVSAIHWLARPHLITFFGVYIFAQTLNAFYLGKIGYRQLLWTLSLTMLIWVNCHPAFLLGIGIIGIYFLSAISEYLFLKTKNSERLYVLGAALILTLLVTLINPYGLNLYHYLNDYLFHTNAILAATDEFKSPVFHGQLQPSLLAILFGIFILGLIITRKKISLPDLLLSFVFGYLSLSAQRNMPLYVIVCLPITAYLYSDTILSSNNGSLLIN